MFGGGETTANVIMVGSFYLLKRPDLVKKLKEELKEYWPDLGPGREPKLSVLEEMPFLVSSTCIKTEARAGVLTCAIECGNQGVSSHWARPSEWLASHCSRRWCDD
jgi:Cytochrome P450